MTTVSLPKLVFPAAIVSSALLLAIAVPFAALGSKSIDIHLQNRTLFKGEVQDLAIPYWGLATAVSLGLGAMTTSALGWRDASRQSTQVKSQLLLLKRDLQAKDAQIEMLRQMEATVYASLSPVPLKPAEMAQPVLSPLISADPKEEDDEDPTEPLEYTPTFGPYVFLKTQSSENRSRPGAEVGRQTSNLTEAERVLI